MTVNNIFLFIFIFMIMLVSRYAYYFVQAYLNNERYLLPKKELISLGIGVSYILTYIIS